MSSIKIKPQIAPYRRGANHGGTAQLLFRRSAQLRIPVADLILIGVSSFMPCVPNEINQRRRSSFLSLQDPSSVLKPAPLKRRLKTFSA